jgi:hypothetical protein
VADHKFQLGQRAGVPVQGCSVCSSSHFGLSCPTKRVFNGSSGRLSVLESIEVQSSFYNPGLGYRRTLQSIGR